MFGQLFSFLGNNIGGMLGGGILSTVGRFAGRMLGNYLEHLNYEPEECHQFKNIRESFYANIAVPGQPIPLIFGTNRVSGKIIWASKIHEVHNSDTIKKYFPHLNQAKSINTVTEYEYYLSFAVSVCEGEVSTINRIWANDELLDFGKYTFRIYLGSEHQLPDPLIEKYVGIGKTPAFRSLSYVVFEDLPLEDFGNSIPNFSFEVTRKAKITENVHHSAESFVSAINMIPGSGEFVYDTTIQYQNISTYYGEVVEKRAINSHNYHNIADSIDSLNQLQIICPNIKWIAPIACWFADNLNIEFCNIAPAVEFNDPNIHYSEEWQVSKYSRSSAKLISKDQDNNPNYGGSVNDASILRYLQELRSRNLKIMFYPMLFMDLPGKPWMGHLTGRASAVAEFFNKKEGYNNFILHYANLVKNHVDAFVIGSELIGLTNIKDAANHFPAVDQLITLAKLVKTILGPSCAVTYAADWSEYHHTNGGWHHLDPLFASEYIDFVGIDAYFPVTNTLNSNITPAEIMKGFQSGEGYDYYIDNNQVQTLHSAYAWKNIKYWWENYHYNPDAKVTKWRPKMKKIWFTEFGFPSIDKATNQPNIFFDPLCSDGGVPRYSSGATDFSVQRKAVRAFIEYWKTQEYIGEMFLWTWDARPYPAWPHSDAWRDNHLWEKGHWVNGKFGACSLSSIILELSARCGISLKKIDVLTLDESVYGLVINKSLPSLDVINSLRIPYFFDMLADEQEKIKFVKRGSNTAQECGAEILIQLLDNSYLEQEIISHDNILAKIGICFINRYNDYQHCYCYVNSECYSTHVTPIIKIPIVLSQVEAEQIGRLILKNADLERKIIKFTIPANFFRYEPGDFLILNYSNYRYQMRIISIRLFQLSAVVLGVVDEINAYYTPVIDHAQNTEYASPESIKYLILDLPFHLDAQNNCPYLAVYLESQHPQILYATIQDNYSKISTLTQRTTIGLVTSFENAPDVDSEQIDLISKFVICCKNFQTIVRAGWNLVLCGNEIIQFQQWKKIDHDLYQLTEFMRGQFATEEFIHSHYLGENFVFLKTNFNIIPVSDELIGQIISFTLASLPPRELVFYNKAGQTNDPAET